MKVMIVDSMLRPILNGAAYSGMSRMTLHDAGLLSWGNHSVTVVAGKGSVEEKNAPYRMIATDVGPQGRQTPIEATRRNMRIAANVRELAKSVKPDVLIMHTGGGSASEVAKTADVPMLFVNHTFAGTNKFFIGTRVRQIAAIAENGGTPVFNNRLAFENYVAMARLHKDSDKEDLRRKCRAFLRWYDKLKFAPYLSVLATVPELDFVDKRRGYVIAARCDEDKRIHTWTALGHEDIEYLFPEQKNRVSDYHDKVAHQIYVAGASAGWEVPHGEVLKRMSRSYANIATGVDDSHGLTVFEAAAMGTPSILCYSGKESVPMKLMDTMGVSMPTLDYRGKDFKGRAMAALNEAHEWSDKDRRKLRSKFQKVFSAESVLRERERMLEKAIKIYGGK